MKDWPCYKVIYEAKSGKKYFICFYFGGEPEVPKGYSYHYYIEQDNHGFSFIMILSSKLVFRWELISSLLNRIDIIEKYLRCLSLKKVLQELDKGNEEDGYKYIFTPNNTTEKPSLDKKCEYQVKEGNTLKCHLSLPADESLGQTTQAICNECAFPEKYARCLNLINVSTKGFTVEQFPGVANRRIISFNCNKGNKIDSIEECIKLDCFEPSTIGYKELGGAIPDEKTILSAINKKQIVRICAGVKVMISSTIKDLEPERQVIEEVISPPGFIPLRSENLSAPGKSSLEVCQMMSRDCDLYVGILGAGYGEEFDEIGTSVVEFEYNVAINDDKSKVLVYIKDVPAREPKQGEFIKRVENFSSGVFRHPYFKNPRELGEYFKADLVTWIAERVRRKQMISKGVREYKTAIAIFGVEWDLLVTEDLSKIKLSDSYCLKCGRKLLNYDGWIEKFPYPRNQIKTKSFSWYCEKCDKFVDHPRKMGLSYIKDYIIKSILGGFRKGTNYIDKDKEQVHIECEDSIGWGTKSMDSNK